MGRGKKVYNKETERARQLNESNKKKYTGEVKQRLRKKIYGEEETNSAFKEDMNNQCEINLNSSVIMENKSNYIKKFRNIVMKKDGEINEDITINLFNNLDNFEIQQFNSIEEANKFCDRFEGYNECLLSMRYELPFPEYYLLIRADNGEIFGYFSKKYLQEVRKIDYLDYIGSSFEDLVNYFEKEKK